MISLSLADDFGTHLANGEAAADFRIKKIEPIIGSSEALALGFSGVRSANSSFMNARWSVELSRVTALS
jgi:hypothetical protein